MRGEMFSRVTLVQLNYQEELPTMMTWTNENLRPKFEGVNPGPDNSRLVVLIILNHDPVSLQCEGILWKNQSRSQGKLFSPKQKKQMRDERHQSAKWTSCQQKNVHQGDREWKWSQRDVFMFKKAKQTRLNVYNCTKTLSGMKAAFVRL